MTHSTYRSFHFRYFLGALFIFVYSLTLPQLSFAMPLITTSNNHIIQNNNPFTIRSVQYIKIVLDVPHANGFPLISSFSPRNYSSQKTENDLKQISQLGYNTIRLVYHNSLDNTDYLSTTSPTTNNCKQNSSNTIVDCVDIRGLNNLTDTINIAEKNNLYVILSFVDTVPTAYQTDSNTNHYHLGNTFLYTQSTHDFGRYYSDLFTYLKNKINTNTLLAIQPNAEPFFSTNGSPSPFPYETGSTLTSSQGFFVTHPHTVTNSFFPINKNQWSGQSSPEIKEFLNDAYTNSFNYLFAQIKTVLPTSLMLYDQFSAYAIKDVPYLHVDDNLVTNPNLTADLIGMQLYSSTLNTNETIHTIMNFTPGFTNTLNEKPFIMIEYGQHKDINAEKTILTPNDRIPHLINWMQESCRYNMAGWNFFNYSADNFYERTTANQDNQAIARALSPKHLPDPCNGKLVGLPVQPNSSTIYLTDLDQIYNFPNPETLFNYGFNYDNAILVNDNYLNRYAKDNEISPVIKGSNPTAYLVSNGSKQIIIDISTLNSLGYGINDIQKHSDTFINLLPTQILTTIPADLNSDGQVDIFDYNILVAGYGTEYDIFDYNQLVASYGN